MTDFELRRDLRDLRGPREPQRDLWPEIAGRIAADSRLDQEPVRRRRRWPLAVAAGIAMMIGVGVFSLALRDRADSAANSSLAEQSRLDVGQQIQRAREQAALSDPRLVSAEVVLDAASSELDHALSQQPDATFLVGLINRTNAQRRKLARLGLDAS
ncbi:MAG: hypothetical protein ABIR27_10030 [Dokdonella sp.]